MGKGGARRGAGRPKGQGKFGVKTKPVRIPETMIDRVIEFVHSQGYALPFYNCAVSAGFPSPADDQIDCKLDLNKHLIKHPTATFFARVVGDSMINAGIHEGDILVVDRSLEPRHGRVVIAAIDGQLTVKRLHRGKDTIRLMPENDKYPPITLTTEDDIRIWGVVTTVLHDV